MTSYIFKSSYSDDSTIYKISYDSNNRISKRTRYNPEDSTLFDLDYWEYNAEGNCIKNADFPFAGVPDIYFEYDYLQGKRSKTRYFTSVSLGAPIRLDQTTIFNACDT